MNDWDRYWLKKDKKDGIVSMLYDMVAFFYRKYIIIQILNFFLDKNYGANSLLLHAGCGNGDVDAVAARKFKILSLDTSLIALKTNSSSDMLVQGDIFHVPIKENSLDGIYNLGLMEHFTENEIIEVLKKFDQVLKKDGKIILFWPSEFSLSVLSLKMVHFMINRIFRMDIKLHPDEITRIKSYSHMKFFSEKTNLKITDYYFGLRDLFTYVVVTLKKRPVHAD